MLWMMGCPAGPDTGTTAGTDSAVATVGDSGTTADTARGELSIEQLHLSGFSTGESLLIVGPDGTSVLLDLGNDSHDDTVLATLDARLGGRAVDWVLITHLHEDHVGGADKLFEDAGVEVRQGLIHRGPHDLDESDTNPDSWAELCGLAETVPLVALCEGPVAATCDITGGGGPWPATSCDERVLDLGGGATLAIVAVNGWAGGEQLVLPRDDENSRSLVAHLSFGDFDAVFGGDLTGGGKDTPDVESHVVAHAALPAEGVDLLSLNHHGIDSSTNTTWLDALLPDRGDDRQVLVGAGQIYLSAPDQDVLDRIGGRVGLGAVWTPESGSLAGEHPRMCVADGSVRVVVTDGASYRVETAGHGEGVCPAGSFTAVR